MTLPEHLFRASNGDLFDTRRNDWSTQPPLRAAYCKGHSKIETVAEFKAVLRYGQHTDLGGYPLYFVCSDGGALSFEAARQEFKQVAESIRTRANDGWRIVACEINYEDAHLHCEHTGKPIPSAYGADE